ncbi:MAG: polysaccharide deacetylase family protein, partial [Pseudolabrys sp.]
DAKDEIEKGFSAVAASAGQPLAPFFRFPALRQTPDTVAYLGERNIAMWSCVADSFDFKASNPKKIIDTVLGKLDKRGKGIILMHDFQASTAAAIGPLLDRLHAGGYKVVQIKGKEPLKSLPEFDEIAKKEIGGGVENARPMSSVIKTISE